MTNTTLGKEGLGQQPWWVVEWMELINSYRYKKRLERAWIYAREGNVLSIRFEGRRVQARVQGTEPEPYKLKLWLDTGCCPGINSSQRSPVTSPRIH